MTITDNTSTTTTTAAPSPDEWIDAATKTAPAADRRDPVESITSQHETRVQFFVPIGQWRMSHSPLALYRGGAMV